jgi:glycogen debranching enzyme
LGALYDVVDVDHVRGAVDASFRPNQILAVGGLPLPLIDGPRARLIVDAIEARLHTPVGLRSLAPGESGYTGRYAGDVANRDGAYHQGTVWPWLLGAFVDAHLRVLGRTAESLRTARGWLAPLRAHVREAGVGSISEIFDGDPPHAPRGCFAQAWSVAEIARVVQVHLSE